MKPSMGQGRDLLLPLWLCLVLGKLDAEEVQDGLKDGTNSQESGLVH